MLFVDGENITSRAQQTCKDLDLELEEGAHFRRDTFFWMKGPATNIQQIGLGGGPTLLPLQDNALRATYYTSATGDGQVHEAVRRSLRDLAFYPSVFPRQKGDRRSKGVDITLTKDILLGAFNDHYDVAVLATGDGDFEPVVHEIRRQGKAVYLLAFSSGLSSSLALACDLHVNLDDKKTMFPAKQRVPAGEQSNDGKLAGLRRELERSEHKSRDLRLAIRELGGDAPGVVEELEALAVRMDDAQNEPSRHWAREVRELVADFAPKATA